MNEREAYIISLHAEGISLRKIANLMRISSTRVYQIYAKAKQKQQQAEAQGYVSEDEPLFKLGLHSRTRGALNRAGIQTVGQALKLLRQPARRHIRDVGPFADQDLREKLKAHGHVLK